MRTRSGAKPYSLTSIRDFIFFATLLIVGPSLVGCAVTGKGSTGGKPESGSPAISVTPSSASFGNVTVNTDATQTMKLSNTGTADLSISKATVTGAGFSMSGLTAPASVAAGASMNFTIAFKPTTAGAGTGSVSITSDAGSAPMTINLTGTGVSASLKLSANAASLSFGDVVVGKTATQDVKLTNTGNANVVISTATASGTGFSATGGSNTTLTPNQAVTVAVNFDPQSKGALSGSLTVTSNAAKIQIPLSGTGTQASQQHTVSLSWSPSISQVIGYFVYRRTGTNGSFAKLVSSIDSATSFTDNTVVDGQTYFYVVTSLSSSDVESEFSSPVSVTIPSS